MILQAFGFQNFKKEYRPCDVVADEQNAAAFHSCDKLSATSFNTDGQPKVHFEEPGASNESTSSPRINIISVMTIPAQTAPFKSDLEAVADSFVNSDFDDSDADPTYEPDQIEDEGQNSDKNVLFEENQAEAHETSTCRPSKGRKRKFPGQTCSTRKKLKDSNQPYHTVKGIYKEPKHFIENYDCKCKKRCPLNISNDKRREFFTNFYNLKSYNLQIGFLAASVKEVDIKRKRKKDSEKKQHSRIYCLGEFEVCKDFFMKTLQITSKRIHTAIKKFVQGNLKDGRGTKSGGKNRTSQVAFDNVIEHIKQFPRYKSHYCRSVTDSLFLMPDLTEAKMYELYCSEERPFVSFATYKKIFYENFNLRRKRPSKDTCNVCDRFAAQIKMEQAEELKGKLRDDQEKHLELAEMARSYLKQDMQRARDETLVETITYDMQKTLPLPNIPTNLVFYKRQLWVYNEGIHSGTSDKGYCFLWKEGDAGRGAQEVGSCIKKYLEAYAPKDIEELILWSDSCGGQNRNIKIVLMLKSILAQHSSLKIIYMKYLISGHSFLPNDSDFGDIESALKYQPRIYTPDDYKSIMQTCRKKNKLIVHNMQREDFFGVEELQRNITNRTIDKDKKKVSWLKTRIIKLEKKKLFSIFFKEEFDEDTSYSEVFINKSLRGRTPYNFTSDLTLLWPNGKEISNMKLKDIKDLLPYIPKDAHVFYKGLRGMDYDDNIEGFVGEVDFAVEQESD